MGHNGKFYILRPDANPTYGKFVYGDTRWSVKFKPVEWAADVEFETIVCPLYTSHRRVGSRVGPLKIIKPSNISPDFSWTWGSEPLITESLNHLLSSAKITGFDVKRAVVVSIKKNISSVDSVNMFEMIITGKGGNASVDTGIEIVGKCEACGLLKYSLPKRGIGVNVYEWDGSDMFIVNEFQKFIIITEKVKNIIMDNRLINCAIIAADEIEWSR